MKCPYRIITRQYKQLRGVLDEDVTEQEFAECYGAECPHFYEDKRYKNSMFCQKSLQVIKE